MAAADPLTLVGELVREPREAGTEAIEGARERVSRFLESLGYEVRLQRFRFSPRSLLAFPVFGAGLGWLTLLTILLLPGTETPPWAALVIWFSGLLALVMLVAGLGLGWATLGETREDANLVATRGASVHTWIVAHLDTKAQGHSMAGRLVAVWVVGAALAAMSALSVARLWGPVPVPLIAGGAALALVAGFLAGRGRLKGGSPGARDNGTGLLAALTVAVEVADPGVGILVTGAEEFGLVGARYFAQQERAGLAGCRVFNFDTVDDRGPWRIVVHDERGRPLADRVRPRLDGTPVRVHRLPFGILVDSVPLARAGAQAITVARLDWSTFRLLHTPADSMDGLTFQSARRAGVAVAMLLFDETPRSG